MAPTGIRADVRLNSRCRPFLVPQHLDHVVATPALFLTTPRTRSGPGNTNPVSPTQHRSRRWTSLVNIVGPSSVPAAMLSSRL